MHIRQRLKNGEALLGTFVKMNAPAVVEIAGFAGFDFVVLDCEHSSLQYAEMDSLIRSGKLAGIDVLVRPAGNMEEHILHALDSGAAGVQVPGIASGEQAQAVIQAAKYYPDGKRGLAYTQRAACYGFMPKEKYLKQANDETLVAIHIENREALDALPEICAVPQIDVLFIGAMDLSQSMGCPGETQNLRVQRAIDEVFQAAETYGKAVGVTVETETQYKAYLERGARFFLWSTDITFFRKAAEEAANSFRRHN